MAVSLTEEVLNSFFGAIQGWFSAGYHGRHLGLILQELSKFQPDALLSFIGSSCGIPRNVLRGARLEVEVNFRPKKGARFRRADLGVFLSEGDEPIILIEIKYFDRPLPETDEKPAQLADYRAWKHSGEYRHVLVLAREIFLSDDLVLRRWDALARHLRPYRARSDLIGMLVEYLEEEGNVMQSVDGGSLMRYFKRLVCNQWQSGRLSHNIEGPAHFAKLMKNMQLVSGNFSPKFKAAWSEAAALTHGNEAGSRTATIDFSIDQLIKAADISKIVTNDGYLKFDARNGGRVRVSATHSLGHGNTDFIRIQYGIEFNVSPSDSADSPPTVHLYAYAYGGKLWSSGLNFYHESKAR